MTRFLSLLGTSILVGIVVVIGTQRTAPPPAAARQ
jgi:hypothetical protein